MKIKLVLVLIFFVVGHSVSIIALGLNNSADFFIENDPASTDEEIGIFIINQGEKHAKVYRIENNISVPCMIENIPFVVVAGNTYRLAIHGNFSTVQNWEVTLWAICPKYDWIIWITSANDTQITKNAHGLTTEIYAGDPSSISPTNDQEKNSQSEDQAIEGFSLMILTLAFLVGILLRRQ